MENNTDLIPASSEEGLRSYGERGGQQTRLLDCDVLVSRDGERQRERSDAWVYPSVMHYMLKNGLFEASVQLTPKCGLRHHT